jgi:hypothetical protein
MFLVECNFLISSLGANFTSISFEYFIIRNIYSQYKYFFNNIFRFLSKTLYKA